MSQSREVGTLRMCGLGLLTSEYIHHPLQHLAYDDANLTISDNDMNTHDEPDDTVNQISIYVGRGMLIESQGPSWFVGTGSEHCVFYQYQVNDAKSVGHHVTTKS